MVPGASVLALTTSAAAPWLVVMGAPLPMAPFALTETMALERDLRCGPSTERAATLKVKA